MAQRKIQLLRSTTIYDSYAAARNSFTSTLATNANLQDGEMLLARYREVVPSIGNVPVSYTIKSILGVYNNKGGLSDFTLITDSEEIWERIQELSTDVANLQTVLDGLDTLNSIGGNGQVVTEITQQNGQVSGSSSNVTDLPLTGYTKDTTATGVITANDTIETALSRLENNIKASTTANTVSSSDDSITVTSNESGTNVIVNVDGTTVLKNNSGALTSGLTLAKITTGLNANVREAYQLHDSEGTQIGSQIDIYKDSALKEAYIGSSVDSVDVQTGDVNKVVYAVESAMQFIDYSEYNNLSATEKALYEAGTQTTYTVDRSVLNTEQYEALETDAKELYYYTVDTESGEVSYNILVEYSTIDETTYNSLTGNQKALYTGTTENGYLIKEDKRYLSQEGFDEIYTEGITNTVYAYLNGPITIGIPPKDVYQTLNFVYHLEDGTYEMVYVDLSKFLVESEFGNGLTVEEGIVSVQAGQGLEFGAGLANHKPLNVKIDPTSNSALSLSSDGLKLDLSNITENALSQINGSNAIDVTAKTNNEQTVSLKLAEQLSTTADAQYAGETSTTTTQDPDTGEDVTTTTQVSNNVLQIKNDGLYLDSVWDCGEYGVDDAH